MPVPALAHVVRDWVAMPVRMHQRIPRGENGQHDRGKDKQQDREGMAAGGSGETWTAIGVGEGGGIQGVTTLPRHVIKWFCPHRFRGL